MLYKTIFKVRHPLSITDAAQQCNRDFCHFKKLVHLVKETRQELSQCRLQAFPEERFVKVSSKLGFSLRAQQ